MLALVGLGILLVRRRAVDGSDLASDFALTLALGLFFNPHLFAQDTVIWLAALACFVEAHRGDDRVWWPFAAFALCWPAIFAVSRALDAAGGSALHVSPISIVMLIAVSAIAATKPPRREAGAAVW
jgi:hypothetical protein